MLSYPEKVMINDEIIDSENAKISVFDRGFLFGDGIYEVMLHMGNQLLLGEEHFQRLNASLIKTGIEMDTASIPGKIDRIIEAAGLQGQECLIYLQVTRGIAPRTHTFPVEATPTLMIYALPYQIPPIEERDLQAITTPEIRWSHCDIKTTALQGNVLSKEQAKQQGCFEALFVREGIITEGSHSNVFFVRNNVVYTHPANNFILNGITRLAVLDICHELGLTVIEEGIPASTLPSMDEAFLTGTTTQVAALRKIDEHVFYKGDSKGTVTRKIQEAFSQLKTRSLEVSV